jgi:hypothetical protein
VTGLLADVQNTFAAIVNFLFHAGFSFDFALRHAC